MQSEGYQLLGRSLNLLSVTLEYPLTEKGKQSWLPLSFIWVFKSIFRVIRSVIKLLQLKTESNQRDYRTSDLATGATS